MREGRVTHPDQSFTNHIYLNIVIIIVVVIIVIIDIIVTTVVIIDIVVIVTLLSSPSLREERVTNPNQSFTNQYSFHRHIVVTVT